MFMGFADRVEGGRLLAEKLAAYAKRKGVIVLALPRGGVVTGAEVAQRLIAPLDVLIVRKLGVPGQEELAMGALATGGVRVLNEEVLSTLALTHEAIEAVAARELKELQRRERAYRGNRPALAVRGRTVIVVDDGIATGTTMRSAVAALQQQQPARIVVAAPVAAAESCAAIKACGGAVSCVCLATPEPFMAVGRWYDRFPQTTDAEVRELLQRAQIKTNA